MARHGSTPGRGFGLRATRLCFADLSTSLSSYTQAGPRPGSQVSTDYRSRLLPSISGDQQQDVEITAVRPGLPSTYPGDPFDTGGRGAGLAYKRTSEADTLYRGWSPPTHPGGWVAVEWGTVLDYMNYDVATIPSSQAVVLVYASDLTLEAVQARVLDVTDWTWGSAVDVDPEVGTYNVDVAVCVLPDETVLAVLNRSPDSGSTFEFNAWASNDGGATWSIYARDIFTSSTGTTSTVGSQKASMAASPTGAVLYFRGAINTGVQNAYQRASSDLGSTWAAVGSTWTSSAPYLPTVLALKSGRFMLVYKDGAGGQVHCRVIGSAFDAFEDADAVQISASFSAATMLAAWSDPDGTVYVALDKGSSSQVRASYDEGATWHFIETQGFGRLSSTTTDYLEGGAATASMGRAVVLHQWTASTGDEDGSLGCLFLGGWSNVESPGWANTNSLIYLPIELPNQLGAGTEWTVNNTGAGTSSAELVSPGKLELVNNLKAISYYVDYGGGYRDISVETEFEVVSGGVINNNEIGWRLNQDDGATNRSYLQFYFTTTGFRIADVFTPANDIDVVIDMTTPIQIKAYMAKDLTWKVWYRRPGVMQWTSAGTGTCSEDASGGSNTLVWWGHSTDTGVGTSRWRFFNHETSTTLGDLAPRDSLTTMYGKALSAAPYPAPDIGTDGTTPGFLRAVSGPARLGEEYAIPAAYDFGADRAFPEISPSPSEPWRSTGTTEAIFAWNLGMDSSLGNSSIFLYLDGINFRTAYLEGWDGATWQTLGTFDAATGFTSLEFARTGDTVVPDAATSAASRYLAFGEAVGGTFDLTGGDLRRVNRQTEGAWYPSNTQVVRAPRLWLDDVDDGTDAATGSGALWLPRGVLVVHTATIYDRYRVRIPSQSTADGYFECGTMLIGSVHPAGKQWSRGWSVETIPNATTSANRYGTTRTTREGPTRRRLSVAWTDGAMLQIARSLTAPFLGSSDTNPLATKDDVAQWLPGVLADAKSGEVPIVVFSDIPDTSGTTITDRSLFLYGRIASSVSQENVTGAEGSTEYDRITSFVVEEIV